MTAYKEWANLHEEPSYGANNEVLSDFYSKVHSLSHEEKILLTSVNSLPWIVRYLRFLSGACAILLEVSWLWQRNIESGSWYTSHICRLCWSCSAVHMWLCKFAITGDYGIFTRKHLCACMFKFHLLNQRSFGYENLLFIFCGLDDHIFRPLNWSIYFERSISQAKALEICMQLGTCWVPRMQRSNQTVLCPMFPYERVF